MLIIGCDFHPSVQQVAIFDNQTAEYTEERLGHREEAERFYRALPAGATENSLTRRASLETR